MASDWNVDDYRMEHETLDHWELRKKFMLAHKDKFPEDKVVCLAQVFSNVEFMGCRYPSETMELVAELSSGIVDEYRNSRRTKLKRTFVAASDAAEAKVKGQKTPFDSQTTTGDRFSEITKDSVQKKKTFNSSEFQKRNSSAVTYGPSISEVVQKRVGTSQAGSTAETLEKLSNPSLSSTVSPNKSSSNIIPRSFSYGGARTFTINKSAGQSKSPSNFSDFVIVQNRIAESNAEVFHRSSAASGFQAELKISGEDQDFKCDVYLNGKLLVTAKNNTKKGAKEEAARMALDQLKTMCHTIVIKNIFASDGQVEKQHLLKSQLSTSSAEIPQHNLLSEDNIGNKLLKLMGWTGGGLGANQQGIKEPVIAQEHVRRAGLGISSHESMPSPEFKLKVWKVLREFAENSRKRCNKSLVFSADFSREERAEIHHMAHKLHLRSRSYNKKDRQLVVSYKYSMQDIIAELRACGGSNDKYELVPPAAEGHSHLIQIE